MWNLDSEIRFDDEELTIFMKKYVSEGYHVYVGTDSQGVQGKYVFATAICMHHPEKRDGVCYFWKKVRHRREEFHNLKQRMLKEATLTLIAAQFVRENIPDANIEVHFDISSEEKFKSNKSMSLITSYAKGFGFQYKIKPNAWAASGAADSHCKR